MAMNQKLSQKMSQKMALTPQMRQSIHILQLPILELKNYLEQEIEQNPTLEDHREESEDIQASADLPTEDIDNYEFDDNYVSNVDIKELQSKRNYYESLIIEQPTLQEYLLRQLNIQPISKSDIAIGEFIIGNIDENGYLQCSVDDIASSMGVSAKDVENTLQLVQTFEPIGVGATNLKECLLIQLKAIGKEGSLSYKIVDKHLLDIAKNKVELIARSLKASPDSVASALKEISSLESKPGRSFSQVENKRILPDVVVEKKGESFEIKVNDRKLPPLKISSLYKNMLDKPNLAEDVKEYLREKLNSAQWLLKAVSQRQETIHKVAEYILEKQKDFFLHGDGHLKPLTMKEVALAIGRNESTISRVVNSKYIQTSFGIIELSHFFTGSYKATTESGQVDVSCHSVKTEVAELIKAEDPKYPLSDSKIVSILKSKGLDIARRTIAKYREELKILPSHLRKNKR